MKKENNRMLAQQAINRLSFTYEHLSLKSIFGGYGISYKNIIFAHVYHNTLYLRASQSLEQYFRSLNMLQLVVFYNGKHKPLRYYALKEYYWLNEELFNDFVEKTIKFTLDEKAIIDQKKREEQRLKACPNISISLERMLNKIGIMDFDMLQSMGAINTYLKLKQYNPSITTQVLFQLAAAIIGCHVAVLPDQRKQILLSELQKYL